MNPSSPSHHYRVFLLLVAVVCGVGIGFWMSHSTITDEQVKETVITTLQQEADTAVLITGYLEIATTVSLSNTRYFPSSDDLPWYAAPLFHAAGTPQVNLGTTRTTARAPGRVSYGFPTGRLTTDDIDVTDEGEVRIRLPELEVYSTEPDLSQLTFHTEVGWARWSSSGHQLERQALRQIRSALHRQGQQHLQDSYQPRIHTTRALEALLIPALEAAGVENPSFEFIASRPVATTG